MKAKRLRLRSRLSFLQHPDNLLFAESDLCR